MALYLVSYNLNKPEQDYPELVDYLYLIGARKVLDSEWLVRSGATRDAVYKGVKAHLESGDGLLVCLVQSAVGDNLTHPLGRYENLRTPGGGCEPIGSRPVENSCQVPGSLSLRLSY